MQVYLGITAVLISILQVDSARTICSQFTHYTMFNSSNPNAKETCRQCPKCPPGQGLLIQCGSRVPVGTTTDCQPCEANKTYSDGYDLSHCKPCNLCGLKEVVQDCTPRQNRKCGGCPPGYYLEPHLDACMGKTRSKSTTTTSVTTATPLFPKTTFTITSSAGTAEIRVSEIAGTNATTTDPNHLQPSAPINDKQITTVSSAAEDPSLTGSNSLPAGKDHEDSKHKQTLPVVIVVCLLGSLPIVFGIFLIYTAVKRKRSSGGLHNYENVEKGERLEMTELRANGLAINNSNDHSRTPLLVENESTASSAISSTESVNDNQNEVSTHENVDVDVNRIPEGERLEMTELRANGLAINNSNVPAKVQRKRVDHSRTPLLVENESTASSAISSTESVNDNQNEVSTHENVDVDVNRIPEVRLVSDMEWLCHNDGVSRMLFHVQKELDLRETPQKKTWLSVGRALDVSANELETINSFCYPAERSPTERLLDLFKTRGSREPTMRKFVRALVACDRKDIARTICNWPWELKENTVRPS